MEIDGLRSLTEEIADLRSKVSELTISVDDLRGQIIASGSADDSDTNAQILETLGHILDVLAERLPKP